MCVQTVEHHLLHFNLNSTDFSFFLVLFLLGSGNLHSGSAISKDASKIASKDDRGKFFFAYLSTHLDDIASYLFLMERALCLSSL